MTNLEFKMGELVGRIDELISRMDRDDQARREASVEAAEELEALELRVRSLEDSRTQWRTTAAVLGAVATGVGALLGWVLSLLTK
jgi:hypothetical protein